MPKPFARPSLTPEEVAEVERLAKVIAFTPASPYIKLQMIKNVIAENMRCLKEINAHRTALGFEPLPVGKAKAHGADL